MTHKQTWHDLAYAARSDAEAEPVEHRRMPDAWELHLADQLHEWLYLPGELPSVRRERDDASRRAARVVGRGGRDVERARRG